MTLEWLARTCAAPSLSTFAAGPRVRGEDPTRASVLVAGCTRTDARCPPPPCRAAGSGDGRRGRDHHDRPSPGPVREHAPLALLDLTELAADHDPDSRRDLTAAGVPDPGAWHRLKPRCHRCHSRRTAIAEPGGWNRPAQPRNSDPHPTSTTRLADRQDGASVTVGGHAPPALRGETAEGRQIPSPCSKSSAIWGGYLPLGGGGDLPSATLEPIGSIPPPASEAQARELAPLRGDPERMAEAWSEAFRGARLRRTGRVTVADVRAAVEPRRDGMAVHYSTATDDWSSPQDLFDLLDAEFGFDLDVCALPTSAMCGRYGESIGRWVAKAHRAAQAGATVVALVPPRVDTGWWWDHCRHGEVFIEHDDRPVKSDRDSQRSAGLTLGDASTAGSSTCRCSPAAGRSFAGSAIFNEAGRELGGDRKRPWRVEPARPTPDRERKHPNDRHE